ncbi:hypothetical protein BUALT_Bualt13G0118100 [Buddleja alternifolia]|uniref:Acyl-[acyl-carrier-protein] hydrolase n=1 Tax=Buddleja alternifolia TaxID=168488 RepID=A0AAV6WL01_9LAMI|nr:hypothetical protein BUALT_Bualt13G0118100 [Buddleja alternifolia]
MLLKRGPFKSPSYAAFGYSLQNPRLIRRQNYNNIVSCDFSSQARKAKLYLVKSEATGEARCKPKRVNGEPSLADRLRLGSLTEDGLSYKEKFIVRCYEVGVNKTATVQTVANLLQEACCNHFALAFQIYDGFPITHTMRKLNLIWVIARMHIEIYKYPTWKDVVEIESWYQSEGRSNTRYRGDWILKNCVTDEVIGRGTSKWVMINQETRRLQKVNDDVRGELAIHSPKTPRLAFPEENNASLKKMPKINERIQYSKLGLVPRQTDLDMNQHVNNVTYIGWILESMPSEIIRSHELQTITLDFRRECQRNDIVDSLTSSHEMMMDDTVLEHHQYITNNGSPNECLEFVHLLRLSSNGYEINRGSTVWRKKLHN